MTQVAAEFDQKWQQRRRVLNTLLVALFIFRLVFSHNRQSYDTTLHELWSQCRRLEIALPQPEPVSAAAMCKARRKLDENFFQLLQRRVVAQQWPLQRQHRWQGHARYAVDGSQLRLPHELRRQGYVSASSPKSHYPQGLVSCLYRLKERLPIDFELVSHGDESALARQHLRRLGADDVVVYDRGYYSYGLLHQHRRRGLHAIFRMRQNTGAVIDRFLQSEPTDQVVTLTASRDIRRRWRAEDGDVPSEQPLRLVRYRYADTTYTLGTTLLDRRRYPIRELSDAYHARWGAEELFKISKQHLRIEQFHARTERGVKQELYAHFVLITLLRQLTNYSEGQLEQQLEAKPNHNIRVNFKHALALFSRHLEELLQQQTQLLRVAITNMVNSIGSCHYRERLGRSYPRLSKQPRNKWTHKKKKEATATG